MRKLFIITLAISAVLSSCKNDVKDPKTNTDNPKPPKPVPTVQVEFNGDSAYKFVAEQVAFGPRVPGTPAHSRTMVYLRNQLARFCDTAYIDHGTHTDGDGVVHQVYNVMGRFNAENQKRFVLAAHWDTRPQADEDPVDPTTPADGANDGASGVGVLIEMARQLHALKPNMGIDIVFFDKEDGGESGGAMESWCIGSQHWSNKAFDAGYEAQNGILLDMVGAKDATFAFEDYSLHYNQPLVLETWKTGQQLGYGKHFVNVAGSMITDDHLFMNKFAGIPTIDIIHFDIHTRNAFPDHWHKHTDNMDVIDANTLKAVGHTVLQVVMNHDR